MNGMIAYDDLTDFTASILSRLGYSAREASVTATALAEADARGVPSHGVSRLAFYRANIDGGFAKPGSEPEIVWETPCSMVVDGHDGVGAYVSDFCVKRVVAKAAGAGTCFCAVRASNHYGMAGLWAEKIAKHCMIGMAFSSTPTCGIPTFGKRRILGTNPISVGIPEHGKHEGIFLLDMATTTVAHGKVQVYGRRKKAMPPGWAVDENGVGITDAALFEKLFLSNGQYGGHLFLGGESEEGGGHKGYGLGLLVELLCAGLSLGMASAETFRPEHGSGITHFFGAARLDLFGDPAHIKKRTGEILDSIRDSETAPGQDRIYIHGEKESESRAKAMRDGVFIDGATREFLDSLSEELGARAPKWM